MAPTLLSLRLSVCIVRACLLCATATAASIPAAAQTMVLDEDYHPQFRARADIRLYPQTDGNLAATGADFLGDDPAPGVFRISPDGTVLNDNGPRDTRLPSWTRVDLADGRHVEAVGTSTTYGWEAGDFRFVITTYAADGSKLHEFEIAAITMPGIGVGPPALSIKLVALPDGHVMAGGNFAGGLVRINADGTRDATFTPPSAAGDGWFRGLLALPDGSVVIARGGSLLGSSATGPGVLTRIRSDGTADAAYSATLDDPALHFSLDDGRIIVGGTQLQRLLANGAPDPSFTSAVPGLARVLDVRRLTEGTLLVEGGYANTLPTVLLLTADGTLLRDLLDLFPDSRALVLDGVDQSGFAWLRHGPSGILYDSWDAGLQAFVSPSTNARVAVSGVHAAVVQPLDVAITPTPTKNGTVYAIKSDGSGRLLISGTFDSIDGQPRPAIARFSPDGSLDPTFVPAQSGSILAVHSDGRVIVHTANGLQRLLANGTVDPSLPADSALARVVATDYISFRANELTITASGGYISGSSTTTIEGVNSCELRRYSPAGTLEMTARNPAGIVNIHGAAALPDGRIIVAGAYPLPPGGSYSYNRRIVRLLADGSVDSTYHTELPDEAYIENVHVFADGSTIAAVDWPGDLSRNTRAVRINDDGSIDPGFRLAPEDENVATGYLYALADGGLLSYQGPISGDLARWDRNGTRDAAFRIPRPFLGFGAALLTPSETIYLAGPRTGNELWWGSPLRRFLPSRLPGISKQPEAVSTIAGGMAMLEAAVGDAGTATFQWQRDGVDIAGATRSRFFIETTSTADSGSYRCIIHVGTTTYVTDAATVTIAANTTKLVNFSARSRVEPGRPQIAGVVIESGAGQPALLRAVGSALPFELGVPLLWDPVLTLYERESPIAHDHGGIWRPEILALGDQLGAFRPRVPPPRPGDPVIALATNSALATTLAPGLYTAHTSSGNGDPGVSLFEYYDAAPATNGRTVRNISIRGATGPGSDVLIAGFVVQGTGNIRLLIRAIGPTLAPFGVSGSVDDPRIILRQSGTYGPDATNDDWAGAAATAAAADEVGAFPLPSDSKDAAFVVTLPAGAYTVQVPAADSQRGEVLCEIYVLDL